MSPLKRSNKMAAIKETISFVFGIDAPYERGVWPFSPDEFSFLDTNLVYEVVLAPHRAIPHEVTLQFDNHIKMSITHGLVDGFYSENMLEEMVVRVTVRHCTTQKVLKDVVVNKCKASWYYEGSTNDLACVACAVCSFSPYLGTWRYSDSVKVQVKLLHPPKWSKVRNDMSARIVVKEGYPFY